MEIKKLTIILIILIELIQGILLINWDAYKKNIVLNLKNNQTKLEKLYFLLELFFLFLAHISNNQIVSVQGLEKLISLKDLDLSYNQIVSIQLELRS